MVRKPELLDDVIANEDATDIRGKDGKKDKEWELVQSTFTSIYTVCVSSADEFTIGQ